MLLIVCWNMAEIDSFRRILSGPTGDKVILLLTFALTVFVDLSMAIGVGLVLASFLFMHRMAEVAETRLNLSLLEDEIDELMLPDGTALTRRSLPAGRRGVPPERPVLLRRGGGVRGRAGARRRTAQDAHPVDGRGAADRRDRRGHAGEIHRRGARPRHAHHPERPAGRSAHVLDQMHVAAPRAADLAQALVVARA
ncbi:MAG: hypothetical protein WDM81_15195 [Rhizomicrobium sp.]